MCQGKCKCDCGCKGEPGARGQQGPVGPMGATGPQGPAGQSPSLTLVNTTYLVLPTDYTVACSSGTFTVTLPTAVGISGKVYNLKNSGTGVITVATTGGQTVDGGTSLTLAQYDSYTVQSNGTNWIII